MHTTPNTHKLAPGRYSARWTSYTLTVTLPEGGTAEFQTVDGVRGDVSVWVAVTPTTLLWK